MINYIIEANVALLIFFIFYNFFLKHETNFRFLRFYMLSSVIISLIVPFVHLNTISEASIPSLNNAVPEYWLPEIVVNSNLASATSTATTHNIWYWAGWIYMAGIALCSMWLIMQLGYVWIMMRNATSYTVQHFHIIESTEDKPTFSFFNLIYIGRVHELSPFEKEQIIRHEGVHAKQLHSLDILLVTLLGILFWFNPITRLYRKIFIQLHEFEADARAVENSDVNQYCSLLAKVALQSYFPIASHFNESLTVKRIEMMRTIKKKVQPWKVVIAAAVVSLCFFVIACQDQILDEVSKSTITQTGDYPDDVKVHMEKYMEEHPGAKLTYMEGEASEMDKFTNAEQVNSRIVYNYTYKKNAGLQKKGVLLTDVVDHAEKLATDDRVFMVVEKMPEYIGGFDAMKKFITDNLKRPKGDVAGTVYISMVINETGVVSDVKVLRGVVSSADEEALRVVRLFPSWIPGEQNGKKVKTRFVLPIRFGSTGSDPVNTITPNNYKMKVSHSIEKTEKDIIIRGSVKDENGKKLSDVTVHVAGTTRGTATDTNGNFTIKIEKQQGQLNLSFVGYDSEIIKF
jgi:TonB family protein